MATSLAEDTLGDKILRFAIGAILGALGAWYATARAGTTDRGEFALIILGSALGVGLLAMALGNRFIEAFLRGRWWN